MIMPLPLDEMSVEEKLQMMESLWDDLRSRAAALASPPWHGDVLAEREAAIESGDDHFEDWNAARRSIENEI